MYDTTTFRPYEPDQEFLLPPALRDWLPSDHLVLFVMDLVRELDLSEIYASYDGSKGGKPPYHPTMMTTLLLYSYCVGVFSSRKIEKACYEQIPFRVLTADQHPDHDTIAAFRRRHLKALSSLFVQVLRLCQKAGLVKLGHVSLDGTKVKANASKHKAMSYARMEKSAKELQADVARLLSEAQEVDEQEDNLYGRGKRGDELPEDLRFKESRLRKIREAMKSLEVEAKQKAEQEREARKKQEDALAQKGQKRKGKKRRDPSDKPDGKAQRNFTDPESRIMKDGASKSFEQCYNCQAAADESQVIVATGVTQEANDKQQVKPMIEAIKVNLDGQVPEKMTKDSGYFSEKNVLYLQKEKIDAYVAVDRHKHGQMPPGPPRGRIPKEMTIKERMARKLRTKKGQGIYKKRKEIIEPVFGQIKEVRGFRRFHLRGLEAVTGEWDLVCLTHNVLKLFHSGFQFQAA
jgi:transposase